MYKAWFITHAIQNAYRLSLKYSSTICKNSSRILHQRDIQVALSEMETTMRFSLIDLRTICLLRVMFIEGWLVVDWLIGLGD